MEKSLANINQKIFEAIWNEAKKEQPNITKWAIYDRIHIVRKQYGKTISTRTAANILASEMGIDVYKNITDPKELEELRELTSRTLLRDLLKKTVPKVVARKKPAPKKRSNRVFIVHGKDTKPVKELKLMLTKLGLRPIILHEQPSGSRTVIEKLEKYSNVGYAFVILTPDDVGYCQKDVEYLFATSKQKHPVLSDIRSFTKEVFSGFVLDNLTEFFSLLKERARQNVILELGYFMARLGRNNVCCLYKGALEYPSDIRGIVYIPFKKSVKETKNEIVKELKGAKYDLARVKKKGK